jgi:hypothetical protein
MPFSGAGMKYEKARAERVKVIGELVPLRTIIYT